MKHPFQPDGHLTDDALRALIQQADLDELTRLELSEHLAYCDRCLQHYTELLTDDVLVFPAQSCRETLWTRVRRRAARIFLNRYATAVAAVGIALVMVWSDVKFPIGAAFSVLPQSHWTERFDPPARHLKLRNPPVERAHQGGLHP